MADTRDHCSLDGFLDEWGTLSAFVDKNAWRTLNLGFDSLFPLCNALIRAVGESSQQAR